MVLKGLRFVSLACAALAMGVTVVHDLAIPGMLAVFAFGNQPINLQVASWTPQTVPANWRALRDAWDGFHTASSALAVLAFLLLLLAILRDTGSSTEEPKVQESN